MRLFVGILWGFVLVACSGIQGRYHTLESGETLRALSRNYAVPVSAIREVNSDILVDGLKPGQKLYIPFETSPDWDREYYESPTPEALEEATKSLSKIPFAWPVKGRISSKFGRRYMRGRGQHFHEGIDIAARKGTPVKAARSGHVVYAASRIPGYGNMVIVQHADKFSTVYAHLTRIGVKKGQYIARGQGVGTVGRTGRTTGAHLHFEVRAARQPVDPMPLLFERVARHP